MKERCETCKRPFEPKNSCFYSLIIALSISLALIIFLGFGTLRTAITHMESLVSQHTPNVTAVKNVTEVLRNDSVKEEKRKEKQCEFPIVYNKPHKTASTRIQLDIFRWAAAVKRPAYRCSPYIRQAILQMRECIPFDSSGCAIVATHVVMSPTMTDILKQRIGEYFLITSTREPRDRLLSFYLQERRIHARHFSAERLQDIKEWLRVYNPWELYNYHTGNNKHGKCPMSEAEKILIPDVVNLADVVIDVDLFNVSQKILSSKGLFPLLDSKANVRSSGDLQLDEETERLIRNATCVEEEMHRMFRLRMASLYGRAVGKNCLSNSRYPSVVCF